MSTPPQLLVHAGTFAALDGRGDITGTRGRSPDGLFVRDARHLSSWRLTVDGAVPTILVPADPTGGTAAVLTASSTRDEPSAWTLLRRQALAHGRLVERVRVTSNIAQATTVAVTVEADADFADQFELRGDGRTYDKPGAGRVVHAVPGGVEFTYRRGDWRSSTTVTAVPAPTAVTDHGTGRDLTWHLPLPAHGSAELTLTVTARAHGAPEPPPAPISPEEADDHVRTERPQLDPGPDGDTPVDDIPLARACAQGLADLALLHIPATGPDGEDLRVPGAGVPWFLTLFGRDSLLTSFFTLPHRPRVAESTLLALAATQATTHDALSVAQPGKIVHEIRHGELSHFRQVPYGRYYGSVDSTPLFVALLAAHARQTGDPALARRLQPHARAAIRWMFEHGGLDRHGYLVYASDPGGLLNQNWKDSVGAVCFADGTQATGTIAVSEAQGYAYDALRGAATLARTAWDDPRWADQLDAAADELRTRFHDDFWLAGSGFPALALDGTGRQVDALASDAGHLLWSGILDDERGRTVGRRLLEPDFFSGWGIRTLAAGQAAYHPLSYHRGSIWPHDNAVIALGLARHGLHEEAARVSDGLLAAAAAHGHRLPEVIAGHTREDGQGPVPYPHSCSPQAWAATTPLALLTARRAASHTP
ncbi:glycogen debranching N-terminal domain-containing protein [Streptomyces sp. NPDC057137]|uniref:amylo-alpha-1,6-glucosidase n=1 Tax=Streptomyces sp. NPDC057137 TaxID=3346030 RepID=UPI00363CF53C